jgi:hypothetical protein
VKVKRVLLTLLIASVLALMMAVPALASSSFTDIGNSPYKAAIEYLSSIGAVGGYPDGTYRPDNELWRAQYAKMADLSLGYRVTAEDVSSFSDTPDASLIDPLYPGSYVAVAAENHIIEGYPDNTFRFYNNLTRQQAITIIVRAAGSALTDPPANYHGELDYSDSAHGQNIKKAEYNGLLDGIPDLASWDTAANATRGEAAQLLSNLLTKAYALRVTGPSGTELFTMSALRALPSVQGHGGYKNKVGTIVGPDLFQGTTVLGLLQQVGGLPLGSGIKAVATDGYAASFGYAQVNGNGLNMYDPATGNAITTITGSLQMIVAYDMNGNPIPSDPGPLRIALVSPVAEQVTDSSKWAKMVAWIEVTPPSLPTVTALDPSTGPMAGGNAVAITGTGFTGASSVSFGTTSLTSGFTVDSDTRISLASAPAGTDVVDVTVTTPGGTSATSDADKYTYYALQVVNGASTKTYTLSALQALPAVQGYGGYKNKAGVIAGPNLYKGATVLGLLDAVGGLPEGAGVKVTASDGYASSFTHDQVNGTGFNMYDPATGDPITTITGSLQMIVAYAKDGSAIGSADGPLRIALVSPVGEQVTESSKWSKMIVKIEVN